MNIQGFMVHSTKFVNDHTLPELVEELVNTRTAVFSQFGAIEVAHQGRSGIFLSLWSKPGQDVVRNFLMRSLEELWEAAESGEVDHRREELVDSFFYLLSIFILDPELSRFLHVSGTPLTALLEKAPWGQETEPLGVILPQGICEALQRFLPTLRNRTWQHSVQQPYWTGHQELFWLLEQWLHHYAPYFSSVESFLAYCHAKHQVLIYRLATNY